MPYFGPFLPCVLLRMLETPISLSHQTVTKISSVPKVIMIHLHAKFQAIHSRCSRQNAQNPNYTKVTTRGSKMANDDRNGIISGVGQDASACQMSGHSFSAFSFECPATTVAWYRYAKPFLSHEARTINCKAWNSPVKYHSRESWHKGVRM